MSQAKRFGAEFSVCDPKAYEGTSSGSKREYYAQIHKPWAKRFGTEFSVCDPKAYEGTSSGSKREYYAQISKPTSCLWNRSRLLHVLYRKARPTLQTLPSKTELSQAVQRAHRALRWHPYRCDYVMQPLPLPYNRHR